jgi:glycine cleavage system H lipoate-binding protein
MKDPTLINRDPYGAGWLVKLEVPDWEQARTALLEGGAVGPAFEAAMDLERFDGPEDA